MQNVPDLDQVRAWVKVPASQVSDDDLEQILAGELAIQARTCRVPDDPNPSPATLTITGYAAEVDVTDGPVGEIYTISWGDGLRDVVTIDEAGDASASHVYDYAGSYPAWVADAKGHTLVAGMVAVPGDQVIPEQGFYPDALARACLRRCQREVAARALPLGILGADSAEYGPITLRAWDAEIVRLEASYRQVVVA